MSALILPAFGGSYGYQAVLQKLEACHSTLEGCSTEDQLKIARFKGIFLSKNELNQYLSQDKQRTTFIPLDSKNSELLTLALATSLGVVAFKEDQEIMDAIQENKSDVGQTLADVGNFLGSRAGGFGISAGTYFLGVYYKNNKLKRAGLFMVSSSLATAMVVTAVKEMAGRARPIQGTGPYDFGSGGKSFYSGHTTESFTIATVISELYKKDYPIVPYVAYGLASITAYARMHDKAHWASDVIVGAIAGHVITKLLMHYLDRDPDYTGGFGIYPSLDPRYGQYSVMVEWKGKEKAKRFECSKMPPGELKIRACLEEAIQSSQF